MPVNPRHAIEVNHVTMQYGAHAALDDVSFAIPEGCYVGIVGPNGGGKTTLLKIIMGLHQPTKGLALVFDQEPAKARLGGKIGYVPQRITQSDFTFPATVEEVVYSGRASAIGIGKWPRKADRTAVESAMELAGIAHLKHRLIGGLSGGERQKVFIARALSTQPKMLILDEPTTGVDPSAREQFYLLLKKLNADLKLTILFVSHDIEVMTNEVSFVLALNQKLLCHCSSHEFLSEETLKRLYGRDLELLHQHNH